MALIETEHPSAGVVVWRVNRLEVRNALNWAAQTEFSSLVEKLSADKDARGLILTGAGETFLSGGDLRELKRASEPDDGLRLVTVMGDALAALRKTDVLTIAAINGPARGGGVEVALACDLRLMAAEADLAMVHSALGLAPGWGGRQWLEDLLGVGQARTLLMTGRVVNSAEAQSLGLVDQVMPRAHLIDAALALAGSLIKLPKKGLRTAARYSAGDRAIEERTRLRERVEFLRLWNREERRVRFKSMEPGGS